MAFIPRHRIEIRFLDLLLAPRAAPDRGRRLLASRLASFLGSEVELFGSGRAGFYYLFKTLPQKTVILPAYTCRVVAEAALLAGKAIRYIDLAEDSWNVDPASYMQSDSAASILVLTHQFGLPIDTGRVIPWARENGCAVIEDCAAAFASSRNGRMVGCDGDAAVFSLEYTKVLSGGRGGFVLFQSEELRRKTMETVRNDPGSKPLRAVCSIFKDVLLYRGVTLPFVYPLFIKWFHRRRGYSGDTGILRPIRDSLYTAGLSGPEAFMALGNLDRVEEIIRKREEIATRYIRELSGLAMVRTPRPEPTDRVSWMRFPLRITGMDKKIFYERMLARGVDLGFSFSYSLSPDRERSRRTAAETVNLPCYSTLSPAEVDRVVSAVKAALDPEGVA